MNNILLYSRLPGRTIDRLFVAEDDSALKFICTDGTVEIWTTEGDCCSESWWADIYNIDALKNSKIAKIQELDLGEWLWKWIDTPEDGRTRQEIDQIYGYQIIPSGSTAVTLVFRNSSNGYYGGSAELTSERDDEAPEYWREILVDDWSAN